MGLFKKSRILFPVDVLKQRRQTWKPGLLAHAGIFGMRRGYIQIIKEDISYLLHDPSKDVIVIANIKNLASLQSELSLPDTCELYPFSQLLEADFIQRLFSSRINSGHSSWIYIIDADWGTCNDNTIWRMINRLAAVGRGYNIIVTFASEFIEARNPYVRDMFSDFAYCTVMPSKSIQTDNVERFLHYGDAAYLEYTLDYEDSTQLPILSYAANWGRKGFSIKSAHNILNLASDKMHALSVGSAGSGKTAEAISSCKT